MLNNRLITVPFAWYSSAQEQEQNMPGCAGDYMPQLIMGRDRLLPFQIRIPKQNIPLVLTGMSLNLYCGSTIIGLDNNMSQIIVEEDAADYVLTYTASTYMEFDAGSGLAPLNTPPGVYFAEIITNYGTWSSEIFCVKESLAPYVKLEWWSDCELAGATYSNGYKNRIYLDAIPSPPRIELDEEVKKDGFGADVPVLQRWRYVYKFVLPKMPHSAAAAISTIGLHNGNLITMPDGRNTMMKTIKAEPEFLECGAILELEFSEEVVLKGSCCD